MQLCKRGEKNKRHLRLVNCLSRSLQRHKWDVSPRCVKSTVTSPREEVTGARGQSNFVCNYISDLCWFECFFWGPAALRTIKPQIQSGDPVSSAWHACNLFSRLWFAHSNTPLFLKRNINGAFLPVKQLCKPLILSLWCMHLWKEVTCAAAEAHTCVLCIISG